MTKNDVRAFEKDCDELQGCDHDDDLVLVSWDEPGFSPPLIELVKLDNLCKKHRGLIGHMIVKCDNSNVTDDQAVQIINACYKLRCKTGINLGFSNTKISLKPIKQAASENFFKASGKSIDFDIEGCSIDPKDAMDAFTRIGAIR